VEGIVDALKRCTWCTDHGLFSNPVSGQGETPSRQHNYIWQSMQNLTAAQIRRTRAPSLGILVTRKTGNPTREETLGTKRT
jgi:hypothetical protein